MLACVALAMVGCGGGSPPASGADGGADGGAIACQQRWAGDLTGSSSCSRSLCLPRGGTTEILDTSSGTAIIRPAREGTFAVGTYAAPDLSSTSLFQLRQDAPPKLYVAGGGSSALPGQSVTIVLTTVVQPSADPCDGVAHGTADVTLVESLPDGGTGSGRVSVHVDF
jgi:hypothetical protein